MQVQQGRVNFTTLAELPEGAPIMTGTFSIDYNPLLSCLVPVQLIASLVTNVLPEWDLILVKPRDRISSTPGGKIGSNQLIRFVPIQLGSKVIKTDLVLLPLEGMDIILGMDWMPKHKVLLDIAS
jgi:hypothetical protein